MPFKIPRRASRQAAFFLLAVVLPSGLLVLLTLRMLVQDSELAEKHAADERRRLAADIRQELLSRVEQIRLTARTGPDSASGNAEPQEVALLARVEAGRVVLPWEAGAEATSAASALEEPRFREAIVAGEQHEFVGGRFDEAAAAYQRAVHIGRLRVQKAMAQHFSARALTKGGRAREADRAYRAMLDIAPDVRDDQGIPFVFYAVRHLASSDHSSASDASAVLRLLSQAVALPSLTPAAIYMAQDLLSELRLRAGDAAHSTADALGGVIAARIRDAEQALELQRTFPMMALPGRGGEPVWTTFGPPENVWLVNAAGVGAPVVTAVRAALVIRSLQTPSRVPGNRTVVIGSAADGEPLTPNFLGLAVSLPKEAAAALAAESRLPRSFYLVALALVVSIALFGGHLFWRDVRREVRMADLRSQFVSSVSHELKTPLTAIRMFAETLMLGRARPEVSQEYLETIVNESERLTRLLNTVLDFSKIEQGKKTYRLQPHSPESIIRAAVKALQYPATQQGFDLRVRVDDDVPLINADPDAIEQALHNLVSNAMKYSGDSRVIELALSKDGASAVVSVTDHGIGISPEEHARIFEKFYRVRNHATERIPGTGLGLALVDHVARAHGGRVTVTSAPGQGSTFLLVVPLLQEGGERVAATKALA